MSPSHGVSRGSLASSREELYMTPLGKSRTKVAIGAGLIALVAIGVIVECSHKDSATEPEGSGASAPQAGSGGAGAATAGAADNLGASATPPAGAAAPSPAACEACEKENIKSGRCEPD